MSFKVLITGAGRGIGLALTKKLLSEGYVVIAGSYKTEENLLGLQKEFSKTLTVLPIDVTDEDSVSKAASFCDRKFGSIDILVNNAAIHLDSAYKPIEEFDLQGTLKTLDVNTLGPLRVVKHFLPLVERSEKKLLVYISSEAGSITNCWRDREYDYCMSKAALNMQARILQNYTKPKGVKVLAIHPGWVRTDMGGQNADISPEESAERIFNLLKKEWSLDDGIYFDNEGKQMPW